MKLAILTLIFGKEVETMAAVYVALILKGKKDYEQVPEKLKEKVKQMLIDLDCPELAE